MDDGAHSEGEGLHEELGPADSGYVTNYYDDTDGDVDSDYYDDVNSLGDLQFGASGTEVTNKVSSSHLSG